MPAGISDELLQVNGAAAGSQGLQIEAVRLNCKHLDSLAPVCGVQRGSCKINRLILAFFF